MADRKRRSISELALIGGASCLDLANTVEARRGDGPLEHLSDYGDLLVWAERSALVRVATAKRLAEIASERPFGARVTIQRARELREDIYRVFRAIADGEEPLAGDLARLTAWWRADQGRRELVASGPGFLLRTLAGDGALDTVLWPVVSSAVELLTSDRLRRVRRCGDCDCLFIDDSRNGTRTWCGNECGNRARARRHYHALHRRT